MESPSTPATSTQYPFRFPPLIVAQRIGTIRHADRIVVLDEGRVAGIGTHDELMKNCSVYREIAMSQLSAAELEKEGV